MSTPGDYSVVHDSCISLPALAKIIPAPYGTLNQIYGTRWMQNVTE